MTGRHQEIVPRSRHRWVVRHEGDPTPLPEHATLTEARACTPGSPLWAARADGTAVL